MLTAVLIMLGLGLTCGTALAVASKVFYVEEDSRIVAVEEILPGTNCGGCGYAGCNAAAHAIVSEEAMPNICVVGKSEVANEIAFFLGVEAGSAEAPISMQTCAGGDRAESRYYYMGAKSCHALSALYGGRLVCDIGCLGLGDCLRSCPFDAINMGPAGYPVVIKNKCVGCGRCKKVCPQKIIKIQTIADRLLDFIQSDDALAPCQTACPAEIDICRYIDQIKEGNFFEALKIIRERNPFPAVCGRVCPAPCEEYCRRRLEDEAVSINQLKRFVTDYERLNGKRESIPCSAETNRKIAIMGGGPAGLSCAYFLRRLGHDVTIFDAQPKLGGILRYGIPKYRLPAEILDWEIDNLLQMGIQHYPNVRLGTAFKATHLVENGPFEAVFIGIGAWREFKLNIKGDDLSGCYTGISFLSRVTKAMEKDSLISTPVGKRCIVVGGGNTAIDCARTLIRLGAKTVSIVYRRREVEMPASQSEINAAKEEGVRFLFQTAPVRILGNEQGKISGIECLRTILGEPDESGRRSPITIVGSETIFDCDLVITALGQEPDTDFIEQNRKIDLTRRGTIAANPETLQTNIPYVFAGGDVQSGASLVVSAIGSGRRAARSIHLYLNGKSLEFSRPEYMIQAPTMLTTYPSLCGVTPDSRVEQYSIPPSERKNSFTEADLTLPEEKAVKEASRCLSCCRICYNKTIDRVDRLM